MYPGSFSNVYQVPIMELRAKRNEIRSNNNEHWSFEEGLIICIFNAELDQMISPTP